MSEGIIKISSKDARNWLESETYSIFSPVHANAQKLLDEMRKTLEEVANVCRMMLENSRKEIEKRNMKTYGRARALNKLARLFLERIRQIKIPDEVSYDSFHEFAQEIQKAFVVTEIDVRNWFPRISPFFIMDRRKLLTVFEKAKESLKELYTFLTKEYVKTKTLEETFQRTDKLSALEEHLEDLEAQRKKAEIEKASIGKEITETQEKIAVLKNRERISQLDQTNLEIKELSSMVKHSLRHLRKPFIKLQSLATHGSGSGLTPEELEKLNRYVDKPFEAFATDEMGYPLLKHILQKLNRAMSEGKLKLKLDRKRKAERDIENIANKNSLNPLHQKCKTLVIQRKQLLASAEVAEIKDEVLRLQEKLRELERMKELIESKENAIERTRKETLENVRNHKNEIEKNVFDFTGRRIQIE